VPTLAEKLATIAGICDNVIVFDPKVTNPSAEMVLALTTLTLPLWLETNNNGSEGDDTLVDDDEGSIDTFSDSNSNSEYSDDNNDEDDGNSDSDDDITSSARWRWDNDHLYHIPKRLQPYHWVASNKHSIRPLATLVEELELLFAQREYCIQEAMMGGGPMAPQKANDKEEEEHSNDNTTAGDDARPFVLVQIPPVVLSDTNNNPIEHLPGSLLPFPRSKTIKAQMASVVARYINMARIAKAKKPVIVLSPYTKLHSPEQLVEFAKCYSNRVCIFRTNRKNDDVGRRDAAMVFVPHATKDTPETMHSPVTSTGSRMMSLESGELAHEFDSGKNLVVLSYDQRYNTSVLTNNAYNHAREALTPPDTSSGKTLITTLSQPGKQSQLRVPVLSQTPDEIIIRSRSQELSRHNDTTGVTRNIAVQKRRSEKRKEEQRSNDIVQYIVVAATAVMVVGLLVYLFKKASSSTASGDSQENKK